MSTIHLCMMKLEGDWQIIPEKLLFISAPDYKRIVENPTVHTDSTIRDLVLQVGYNDVPNFLRKFKSIEGVTPSQYRQLQGKQ